MNFAGGDAAALDGDVILVGVFVTDVGKVARAGEIELAVGDDEPLGRWPGAGVILAAQDCGRSIGKGGVKALSAGPQQPDHEEEREVFQSDKS